MNGRRVLLALLLALLAASSAVARDTGPAPDAERDALRLLVTLVVPDSPPAGGSASYRRPSAYSGSVALEAALDRIARDHGLERIGGWTMRALNVWCEVFEARDADSHARALVALAKDPSIDSAQPMLRFEAQSAPADPYRDLQPPAIRDELDAAHRIARGRGVRIAVIDAGVDASHADLRGAVSPSHDYVGGGTRGAHGTAVAGVIAARAGNGVGIAGVAPESHLVDLRACWQEGEAAATACNSYTLARALDAAVASRVAVINLSLAGPQDALLTRLLDAAERAGAVVVAAVPPGVAAADAFPAQVDTVLAVVETERAEPGAVHAPGRDVLTTQPGDRYDFASGSSIAAAHVSGVAALYREARPKATPAQVRAAVRGWPALPLGQLLGGAAH